MRNDPKIKALRSKFRDGYAVYNMLLEVLADAENFHIEADDIQVELLAGDFGVESSILTEIIEYCIKVKLLTRDGELLFSKGLKKRLQPVLDKRTAAKDRFLLQKNKSEGVSATEMTQSKVKESKVKESSINAASDEEPEMSLDGPGVISQMAKQWIDAFPKYPFMFGTDPAALVEIAKYICKAQNRKYEPSNEQVVWVVLNQFKLIVKHVQADNFFCNWGLSTLATAKNYQMVIQSMNKAESTPASTSPQAADRVKKAMLNQYEIPR